MSKPVKNMIIEEYRRRFDGVSGGVLVHIRGMEALDNNTMRNELRKKSIQVTLLKNTLAKKAFAGTPLEALNPSLVGPSAFVHGAESPVDVAREIIEWAKKVEQIELQAQGPEALALVVDGSVKATALRSKISRFVLLGSATPATTSVDPALGIPVEWASSGPVAFDDSISLARASRSLAFDPLQNDVGTDLDPSTLEIVAQPLVGSASVDLARAAYSLPTNPSTRPMSSFALPPPLTPSGGGGKLPAQSCHTEQAIGMSVMATM